MSSPPPPPPPLLKHDDYCIALYYIYLKIPDAADHVKFHTNVCQSLSLTGRIRVAAKEGLNGVLSGRIHHLQQYEEAFLQELSKFYPQIQEADLDLKYCALRPDLCVPDQLFASLIVKETKTVIGLVDLPLMDKTSRKTKKRNQTNTSDASFVRQVYERAMEQFEKEEESVPHLSPQEWDEQLAKLSEQPEQSVVLLDCRNVYESNVGHFQAPHTKTILTNTRKYAELPQVLVQQAEALSHATQIFAYCTGGVRCERATVFLKELLRETHPDRPSPQIYQLKGGIQRYLQHANDKQQPSLFKGKNFVFDPRRVDPLNGQDTIVGQCLVCQEPHDDYDNGQSPALDRASRCWDCRVLILVCQKCRPQVSCWGDNEEWNETSNLPRLFCGVTLCWHRPPVQVLADPSTCD